MQRRQQHSCPNDNTASPLLSPKRAGSLVLPRSDAFPPCCTPPPPGATPSAPPPRPPLLLLPYLLNQPCAALPLVAPRLPQLFLEYGQPAPVSLSPCGSASSPVACAAVALDAEDGDLTPSLSVADVTACAAGATCLHCKPEQLTLGTCLPGTYTLR